VHSIKVIAIGIALLVVCLVAGRLFGGSSSASGLILGAKLFLPLWFVGSAVNMWLGVSKAGYTVADEAPVFALVFAVPAGGAAVVWWLNSRG
jgi:hypothetical protein